MDISGVRRSIVRAAMTFLVPVLACVAAFSSSPALGQDWAKAKLKESPRHLEWVDVKYGDRTVKTLVAYPEVKTKAKVVVIIHEIFGMSDWVQLMADDLAAAGYIALAPDLLSGMGPNGGRTDSFDPAKVREAISGLPAAQVDADLSAVCDYGKKIPAGNGTVSVGGFCWGGTTTFRFATVRPDISAAYVFYGSAPTDAAALAKIKAPVYGFYAENDNRINATLDETTKLMKEAGKTFEPVIYAGAGHGFMRAGADPAGNEANKKAREDGMKRWLELLSKN